MAYIRFPSTSAVERYFLTGSGTHYRKHRLTGLDVFWWKCNYEFRKEFPICDTISSHAGLTLPSKITASRIVRRLAEFATPGPQLPYVHLKALAYALVHSTGFSSPRPSLRKPARHLTWPSYKPALAPLLPCPNHPHTDSGDLGRRERRGHLCPRPGA